MRRFLGLLQDKMLSRGHQFQPRYTIKGKPRRDIYSGAPRAFFHELFYGKVCVCVCVCPMRYCSMWVTPRGAPYIGCSGSCKGAEAAFAKCAPRAYCLRAFHPRISCVFHPMMCMHTYVHNQKNTEHGANLMRKTRVVSSRCCDVPRHFHTSCVTIHHCIVKMCFVRCSMYILSYVYMHIHTYIHIHSQNISCCFTGYRGMFRKAVYGARRHLLLVCRHHPGMQVHTYTCRSVF
jgi:hypothetical protein